MYASRWVLLRQIASRDTRNAGSFIGYDLAYISLHSWFLSLHSTPLHGPQFLALPSPSFITNCTSFIHHFHRLLGSPSITTSYCPLKANFTTSSLTRAVSKQPEVDPIKDRMRFAASTLREQDQDMANIQNLEESDRISDGCPVFCTAEVPAEVREALMHSCRIDTANRLYRL